MVDEIISSKSNVHIMQDCISIQISQGVQIDNLFIHGNNNQLFLDTKVDIFDVEIIGDGNVIKA